MAVNFKIRVGVDAFTDTFCDRAVKVKHLSAVGTLHMKVVVAVALRDKLIDKFSAVALDRAVYKSLVNKLCHQAVNRALAYGVA